MECMVLGASYEHCQGIWAKGWGVHRIICHTCPGKTPEEWCMVRFPYISVLQSHTAAICMMEPFYKAVWLKCYSYMQLHNPSFAQCFTSFNYTASGFPIVYSEKDRMQAPEKSPGH